MNRLAPIGFIAAMTIAGAASALTVSSKDFANGAAIPTTLYYGACAGTNTSPELSWTAPPAGTKSLVLTMIDPDANPGRGWSHWLVVDLPATSRGLPAHTTTFPTPAKGTANNFGHAAYDGPCPPKGSGVHHYHFNVWAMPKEGSTIPAGYSGLQVIDFLKSQALGVGELIGTAER